MLITKSVKDDITFGKWKDAPPSTVVGSAYDTSGNGGRKLVRLSNGWIVAAAVQNVTSPYMIYFYVSKDNGQTWSQLCFTNGQTNFAIANIGNVVTVAFHNTQFIYSVTFDATTVTNINLDSTKKGIMTANLGAAYYVSLAADGLGVLHVAFSALFNTQSNSKNMGYSKSTDGGVTWAAPTQVTTNNSSGADLLNPCIVTVGNNRPIIFVQNVNGTLSYTIDALSPTGMANVAIGTYAWNFSRIYDGGTYSQANPCAAIDSNDVIHVAWQGADSGLGTHRLRYSKSSDGGTTWTAMVLVDSATDGVGQPSLTIGNNGKLYVYAQQTIGSAPYQLIQYTNDGTGWSAKTTVTSFTTTGKNVFPQTSLPSSDGMVRLIYMDGTGSTVKYDASPRPKVEDNTPAVPEIYIPLWWHSGDGCSVPSTNTLNVIRKGSVSPSSTVNSSSQLYTMNTQWPESTKFALEVTLWIGSGYTVTSELRDLTDNVAVSNSRISTTATSATFVRSGQFTLKPGHVYGVAFWSSNNTVSCSLTDASLIVFPS